MTTLEASHSTRARRALVAALFACALGLAVPSGAVAQQTSTDRVTKPEKDGWWNRRQPPEIVGRQLPSEESVLPLSPDSPTVPQDAIAVGSQFGEPDKVAAVGFRLDAPLGADVTALTLTLHESSFATANVNADHARIIACPISNFWGSGQRSAAWDAQPLQVCDRARVEGSRSPAGVWTFDLRPMAPLWLAPSSSVGQHGVLLSSDPPSDGIVQVSLLAVASDDATVHYSFTPPADTDEVPGARAGKPRERGAEVVGRALEARLTSAAAPVGQGEVGRIPAWAYLIIPLVVGLALVVSYTLGPRGDPGTARRREGSISRALGRRREDDRGNSS